MADGVDFRRAIEERLFLTSAGAETHLLFRQGFALREFCAFELFDDASAVAGFEDSFLFPILDAAASGGHGILLDALVWRAQSDFVTQLGYAPDEVGRLNRHAVEATRASLARWVERSDDASSLVALVAADLGPRGDGYVVSGGEMTPDSARAYHAPQIEALAAAGVDLMTALTMTTAAEATGIARAALETGLPTVVSPTVETDGSLPDGSRLADFVARVDDATGGGPLFYMVNCAHPSHLEPTLRAAAECDEDWLSRFRGLRANASRRSHAELDESEDLDRGDPRALARELARLHEDYGLRLLGGCCGTDAEHIQAIVGAVG